MEDYKVICKVCGQIYENWAGSTPCCGSIAYVLDEKGEVTKETVFFYVLTDNEEKQ